MTRLGARTAAGLALGASFGLVQCDRPSPTPPEPPSLEAPEAPPSPRPILTRPELLSAAAAAASDAAAGVTPSAQSPLDGRQFRLSMAFGCQGEEPLAPGMTAPRDGAARWTRSDDGSALRLTLSPADWSAGDPTGPAPDGFEGIEGVWIPYPWMNAEGCPVSGPPPTNEGPGPIGPRVGLAMLRQDGASRLGRSVSGDFTHIVRGQAAAPAPDPVGGYRLEIEGRLKAWADGRVVRCRAVRPDAPPPCVIGAEVDRVAIRDASGARLSEWHTN